MISSASRAMPKARPKYSRVGLRSSWGITEIDRMVAGGFYVLADVSRMLPLSFALYRCLPRRGARLARGSRRRGVARGGGREGAR